MLAKMCDWCHGLYEEYDGSDKFKMGEGSNMVQMVNIDLLGHQHYRKTYTLCPECMKEFESLIESRRGLRK